MASDVVRSSKGGLVVVDLSILLHCVCVCAWGGGGGVAIMHR